MRKKETIYITVLLCLAFYLTFSMGSFALVSTIAAKDHPGAQAMRQIFIYSSFVYLCYIIAIIVTVTARYRKPELGRTLSKALNIILLLLFPFGTIAGVYGLLKVDKEPEANSSTTTESE